MCSWSLRTNGFEQRKRQLLQTGREDVFVRLQFNLIWDLLSCFDILTIIFPLFLTKSILLHSQPNETSSTISLIFSYKHTETRCSHTVKSTQNIFLEDIKGSQSQVWFDIFINNALLDLDGHQKQCLSKETKGIYLRERMQG